MIGCILTPEQQAQAQGQLYSQYEFFNCVQDIDGVWFLFLTEQDKAAITDTEWAWLLNLPEGEYTPPPAPPFPDGQS